MWEDKKKKLIFLNRLKKEFQGRVAILLEELEKLKRETEELEKDLKK